MKVDSQLILQLRKARSWSQEELAIASGLNLRTIQRIENHGTASLQSKKSLASAFEIEVSQLEYTEKPTIMKYEYKVITFDVKGFFGGKIDYPDMENQLNQQGSEGWDLVDITGILKEAGLTVLLVATLKRPLRKE